MELYKKGMKKLERDQRMVWGQEHMMSEERQR